MMTLISSNFPEKLEMSPISLKVFSKAERSVLFAFLYKAFATDCLLAF
jgi:hypothetical protein